MALDPEYPPDGAYLIGGPVLTLPSSMTEPYRIQFQISVWRLGAGDLYGWIIEYGLNGGPFIYSETVAQYAPAVNLGYVTYHVWFTQWSQKWMTIPTSLVTFRVRPSQQVDDQRWTPNTSFVPPLRVPTLAALQTAAFSADYPWVQNFRITTAMPVNKIIFNYGFDNQPIKPTVTYAVPPAYVGQSFERSFADWSSWWKTHHIKTMQVYIRTWLNTDPASPDSNVVSVTVPDIYPVWQAPLPVLAQTHVTGVVLSGTVQNVGRPTKLSTFTTWAGATPEQSIDYAEAVHGVEPGNIQRLGWLYGQYPDGAFSRILAFAALNMVGSTPTEQWLWDTAHTATVSGTVVTAPVLSSIYIAPTPPDRLTAQITTVWQMVCPGRGVEIEYQQGETGTWEPLTSVGGDTEGGADSYQVGDTRSFTQTDIDTTAGTYSYRARCFYVQTFADIRYGSWSDVAEIDVGVNFGIHASSYEINYKAYDAVSIIGYWFYEQVGAAVEQVTLWMQQEGSETWVAQWSGPTDAISYPDLFLADSAIITLPRNTSWRFTFTDGLRPPDENDRYEWIVFDDSATLTVAAVVMENEDEFA
jgi:hypothetical protein